MFTVEKTCYDVNPRIPPYKESIGKTFPTREAAMDDIESRAEEEVAMLNSGDAEGFFRTNFMREDHDAVVEFWEGEPTEGDRDMRPVTIYDVIEV